MKKYIGLVLWAAILGGISSLFLLVQSNADDPDPKADNEIFLPLITTDDSVSDAGIIARAVQSALAISGRGAPFDGFTFFIPFDVNSLDDMFNLGQSTRSLIDVDIETIISIAVDRNNSVIYYDQWEDGLESSLRNPVQPSTQIWGDNNVSNGFPPTLNSQPNVTQRDILQQGDIITLRNIIALPRVSTNLFFDSGDSLTSSDGAIAVSVTYWTAPQNIPQGIPGILYADAWELYPTNRWGTDYRIPIGENLGNLRRGFTVVCFTVQAMEDNTTVEIDLNGDGVVDDTRILNQGQSYTQLGGVQVGARIHASLRVQVQTFAADPQEEWEARGSTIIPEDQWTDEYLAPRASDGDFWLYNPSGSTLSINVESATSTTLISIPPNSSARYPNTAPPFDDNNNDDIDMSGATGLHFTSTDGRPFIGLAALDATSAQDWDYPLLPVGLLDTQALVGLGIGNNNQPTPGPGNGGTGFESRVYVTALEDTIVFVDYNNDKTIDAQIPVSRLEEVDITDPTDFDMTGARLSTNGAPIAVAWGQDASSSPANPSIDAGTGVVPLPSLQIQKSDGLVDLDCTGTYTLNDIIKFRLFLLNNAIYSLRNITVSDTLPPEVAYVPNSTIGITGALIPDSGSSRFPLDEGGANVGQIPALGQGAITFDVVITDDSNTSIINQAQARSENALLGSSVAEISLHPQPAPPLLQIEKTLLNPASGFVTAGQVITFGLTITNTSSVNQAQLALQDAFDDTLLTFLSANSPPDLTSTGVITWDNLAATFGPLAPGATINLTMNFVVDPLPPTLPETLNVASIVEAQGNNTPFPVSCSDSAAVQFFAPEPGILVKKATNGFDADNPNTDPIPQIAPGKPVTWDYRVTNTGNVPLANVTLEDDQLALLGVTPAFIGGDTNIDNLLDLDETWLYRATGVAEDLLNSGRPRGQCGPGGYSAPIYTNMAQATGEYGPTTVIDEDPSHYCPPVPTPTPTRQKESCKGDCRPATSTPQPPPGTPVGGTPVAQVTVPFPIAFLPETGTREASQANWGMILALLTLTGASLGVLYRWYRH